MLDCKGHQIQLSSWLEHNQANETLGTWIAMDGSQEAQVTALEQKAMKCADQVQSRHLTSSEAWLSLAGGISKSVEHPLTVTSLSQKQCSQTEKPILKTPFASYGIHSKLSTRCAVFSNHLQWCEHPSIVGETRNSQDGSMFAEW